MIEGMLNQTAVWKRKTGDNEYGEPLYADPVTIKVRWEGKRRLVRNSQGKEVVSEARVFCMEQLSPDDTLTYDSEEWTVITAQGVPNLAGIIRYWEVAC